MDEVHSSSFENIQGVSVGTRPRKMDKDTFGELVGLISFPILSQWTSGTDQSVLYQLNSRGSY